MSEDKDVNIVLNGKTYTISSRPNYGFMEKVKQHMLSDNVKLSGDILREWPEGDLKTNKINELTKKPNDTAASEYLNDTDGKLFFMWLCLNANHPEISFHDFSNMPIDITTAVADTVGLLNAKKKKPGRPAKKTEDK